MFLGEIHKHQCTKQGHGEWLPAERVQLLDSCLAVPRHSVYIHPTVLDE